MLNNNVVSMYRDRSESNRYEKCLSEIIQPVEKSRILLVDDDPVFAKIIKRAAEFRGVSLAHCSTLDEFAKLQQSEYDVLIMDYDLGAVTGLELASYYEKFSAAETPVILVSKTARLDTRKWPDSIREFVHKDLGPLAILSAAFEAHDVSLIHKKISNTRH